jgi:hypothetical protein
VAKYKQSRVGKPSLDAVVGDGTSEKINMPRAGQVVVMHPAPGDAVSRDPGQPKAETDPRTPLNRS